jgi:hypothetical protein
MYKELAGNEVGLQVYYKMSDGSGTRVSDNKTVGTAINGTLVNGPIWKTSGCLAGPRNTLELSRALSQSVETPTTLSDAIGGQQKITIAGWVKPTSLNGWQTIFNHKNPTVDKFRTIIQSGDGADVSKFCVSVSNGVDNKAYTRAGSLVVGKWTHFAVVFDGSQSNYNDKLKIFLNGVQEPLTWDGTSWPATTLTSSNVGYIGSETDLISFFDGAVDEFSFWNVTLTPSQIRDIMMRSLTGNEAGLQAYYRFDENTGTTVYDISANKRDATLKNKTFPNPAAFSTAFNTWIGSESNSWSNGANWSTGAVPPAETNVGVYNWNLGNSLAIASVSAIKHMLIASGSTPTLDGDITMYGNLIVNSNLDLNGKTITLDLGNDGYLLEGSGRLFGANGSIRGPVYIAPNSPLKDDQNLGFAITSPNELEIDVLRKHNSYIYASKSSIARNFTAVFPLKKPGIPQLEPPTPTIIEFIYN